MNAGATVNSHSLTSIRGRIDRSSAKCREDRQREEGKEWTRKKDTKIERTQEARRQRLGGKSRKTL